MPNKIYNGQDVPSSNIGIDGDYYLNEINFRLYFKQQGIWLFKYDLSPDNWLSLLLTNSNYLLNGSDNPNNSDGSNGDFYINTTSNFIFGPKTGDVWPAGVSITGAQGTQGIQGDPGAQGPAGANGADGRSVLNGSADPDNAIGSNGDFYINTTSNFIFGPKAAGIWPAGVSIIGAQGPQGVPGAAGAQGPQGIQGDPGAQGPAGANGADGAPGINGYYSNLAYQALGSTIKAETVNFPLAYCNTALALTDNQSRFIAIYLPNDATITGVCFYCRTTGNFTGDQFNGLALYSYNNGTMTKVAETANDQTIWKQAANSIRQIAFSVPYAAQAGIYFIGLLYNNSAQTTAPAIAAGTAVNNAAMQSLLFTNSAKLSGTVNTQNSLPSSRAMTGVTGNTAMPWMALY